MGEIAGHLYLEISSVTRVVDQLVCKELATRQTSATDRRVNEVKITPKGRSLVAGIRQDLLEEYQFILRKVSSASREDVITTMELVLAAFQSRCAKKSACEPSTTNGEKC